MRFPPRWPTTPTPWPPGPTGCTPSKPRTPIEAAGATPTPSTTGRKPPLASPPWPPMATPRQASSPSRSRAMPAGSCCPMVISLRSMRPSVLPAGWPSPTRCRWATAASATGSGASSSRTSCRISSPSRSPWAMGTPSGPSSPPVRSRRPIAPAATSSPPPAGAPCRRRSDSPSCRSSPRRGCRPTRPTPALG